MGGEGVEWKSNELRRNYLPVLALRGDGPPSSLLGESRGKCRSRIVPLQFSRPFNFVKGGSGRKVEIKYPESSVFPVLAH